MLREICQGNNDRVYRFSVDIIFLALANAGVLVAVLRPHSCKVEVPGLSRTQFPDLTVLAEEHVALIERRERVTRDMPPLRFRE